MGSNEDKTRWLIGCVPLEVLSLVYIDDGVRDGGGTRFGFGCSNSSLSLCLYFSASDTPFFASLIRNWV